MSAGRSAANPPHAVAAVDRWDRQTDGRTLGRFVDSAQHTMRAVSTSVLALKGHEPRHTMAALVLPLVSH